jgi:hypothetical protein
VGACLALRQVLGRQGAAATINTAAAHEPSFGQEFLDIAVAQGEAEIEPDRVLDDLGREAMAAVAERAHADILRIRRWLPTRFP